MEFRLGFCFLKTTLAAAFGLPLNDVRFDSSAKSSYSILSSTQESGRESIHRPSRPLPLTASHDCLIHSFEGALC